MWTLFRRRGHPPGLFSGVEGIVSAFEQGCLIRDFLVCPGHTQADGNRDWTTFMIYYKFSTNCVSPVGFSITRLPSTGGFLKRKITTLLLGIPSNKEEVVIKALESSCQRRSGYFHPTKNDLSIDIGRATIFCFEIERFEEL